MIEKNLVHVRRRAACQREFGLTNGPEILLGVCKRHAVLEAQSEVTIKILGKEKCEKLISQILKAPENMYCSDFSKIFDG